MEWLHSAVQFQNFILDCDKFESNSNLVWNWSGLREGSHLDLNILVFYPVHPPAHILTF